MGFRPLASCDSPIIHVYDVSTELEDVKIAMRHDVQPRHSMGLAAIAGAVGAMALGAFAVGALAIGALAIRKLAIGRGAIKSLRN